MRRFEYRSNGLWRTTGPRAFGIDRDGRIARRGSDRDRPAGRGSGDGILALGVISFGIVCAVISLGVVACARLRAVNAVAPVAFGVVAFGFVAGVQALGWKILFSSDGLPG